MEDKAARIEALKDARERVWDTAIPAATCKTIEAYLDDLIEQIEDGRVE